MGKYAGESKKTAGNGVTGNKTEPPKVRAEKPFKETKTRNGWWITCPGILVTGLDRNAAKRGMRALNKTFRELFLKPKRSPTHGRNKGLSFEREIAIKLRPWYPQARRQLEFQEACALGTDLAETGFFRIQCKKFKKYVPISTIFEVQCDRELGEIPLLVTAGDGEPAMVALHLDDFLALLPCPSPPGDGGKSLNSKRIK